MKLQQKVALVTGGGSGIGAVIAQHLAEQGAKVLIIGRSEQPLQQTAASHANIDYFVADVANSADIQRTIAEIHQRYGRLDILVNNAGVAPVVALAAQNMEDFDRTFAINVRGSVDCIRQSLALLKASKGSVINITSSVSSRPLATMAAYSGSKAAMTAITKALGKELAADGIRVNAVSVGPIETPIYQKTALSAEQAQAHVERVSQLVPLGRFGKPEEVATMVAFLASDEASYITASEFAVDGGFAA